MRRLSLLIVLVALPLLAIACRDGGGSLMGDRTAAEVLGSVSDRAADESSFRFEFEADFDSGDSGDGFANALFGELSLTGEGAADLENDRIHMTMNVIIMEVEIIQDGDICYTRSSWFGDLWEREACDFDQPGADGEFFFGDNPAGIIDALREHSDEIEDLGEETINGVVTRHYRTTVSDPSLTEEAGVDEVPVDIWIDGQGRPAQIRIEMEVEDDEGMAGGGDTIALSLEFRFFDWGQPVDITIPSEDEIGDGSFFGLDDWDDEDWDWPWGDEDAE